VRLNMSTQQHQESQQLSVDPCRKYACELQDCLMKANYNETKCETIVNKLKQCCVNTYGHKTNASHISPTCSGFIHWLEFLFDVNPYFDINYKWKNNTFSFNIFFLLFVCALLRNKPSWRKPFTKSRFAKCCSFIFHYDLDCKLKLVK